MTREQIVNRLQLGRRCGAEVDASSPGNREFLFVNPRVNAARGELVNRDSLVEPELRRKIPNEDVITSYDVEYLELRPGWEVQPDDWDRRLYSRERISCATIAALEHELRDRWKLALAALKLPADVDHPF